MQYRKENTTDIYFFLEKCEQLPLDFSMDKVIAFEHEDDFYIVFYIAQKKKFLLFNAENYLQIPDALPDLLNQIIDYSQEDLHAFLIDEAIKCIENKMHSKNNFRFYFDAH